MRILQTVTLFSLLTLAAQSLNAADDLVIADFEGADYGSWKATGEAFGAGPARGTLPGADAGRGL